MSSDDCFGLPQSHLPYPFGILEGWKVFGRPFGTSATSDAVSGASNLKRLTLGWAVWTISTEAFVAPALAPARMAVAPVGGAEGRETVEEASDGHLPCGKQCCIYEMFFWGLVIGS